MASRRRFDDDAAWSEPAIGEDPNKPKKMPGTKSDTGRVSWIGEAFWKACDIVPLSIPRWSNRPKMNANIRYLMKSYDEDTIKASFGFFRNEVHSLAVGPGEQSCWDMFFRRRGKYLRVAQRAREGARPGESVHKAGDIHVDNDRLHVRGPGEATDTDEIETREPPELDEE